MKETFYFPHDYNARNDDKVVPMLRKLDWYGYGLYWALIEKLAESSEARLRLDSIDDLAYELRTQCERIKSVVFDFNLFCKNDDYFWSNRLLSHLSERNEKSKKAKLAAKIRWQEEAKKNANAMQPQCKHHANAMQGKERKGKERKIYFDQIFEKFWSMYPKKIAKAKVQKKFNRLKKEEVELIFKALPEHMESEQWQDMQYIPNPETWLNQKRWEDILPPKPQKYEIP